MATRNISLTPAQDAFVAKLVSSGEYQNASEAVRDALRALRDRRKEQAQRLRALRAALDEGLAALDAGDHVELSGEKELSTFMRSLVPRRRKPRR